MLMFLARAHAALGEIGEAARTAVRLKAEFPEYSVERFVSAYPVTNLDALSAIRDAAEVAKLGWGLPDSQNSRWPFQAAMERYICEIVLILATMVIALSNLRKSYETAEGRLEVLRGVNLDLGQGDSVALTGESGSGKSTLLHLVAGLDRPDSGEIVIGDRDISKLNDRERAAYRRTEVGLVFQQFNLVPSLDVAANIAFHAKLAGRHDPLWENELVARLGIGTLLTRYPEQLSIGQQQRVAIGRTLAARPGLLLADEPTGNLDEANGDAVLELMLSLSKATGSTLLLVTHSQRLADRLDRQVHLRSGKME